MGFHNGAYARVWEVKPFSGTMTQAKITISERDKKTNTYSQKFGKYVTFIGAQTAAAAAKLKKGDKIKLVSVDVENFFNEDFSKEREYFRIFSFEPVIDDRKKATEKEVDSGEPEEETVADTLPF